jgi:membrane protein DedA with SNARE-associated domain
MQKYLHRIPVLVAVFFTAFISLGLLITLGALQGDIRLEEPVNIAWQSLKTIIIDLIVASAVSGLILWLDKLLTSSEENHEEDSEGGMQEGEI